MDFAEIEACQAQGEWDHSADLLGQAARRLELAGTDFIVICTNTMHKIVPQLQTQISIPALHIADAAVAELKRHGNRKRVE